MKQPTNMIPGATLTRTPLLALSLPLLLILLTLVLLWPAAGYAQSSAASATAAGAPQTDPLLVSRGSWGQDYADQWGLYAVGRFQADGSSLLSASSTLTPVTVAVIDTGVDYSHPDLPVERLWRNPDDPPNGQDDDDNGLIDDLIGWNFVDRNNSPWDDNGHGSHVAGIIAAQTGNGLGIAGVAPNARLMVLKALDGSGHGNGSDIAHAIRYAADKGARIIHLSLGGEPPSTPELEALSYALARDILVVTAAGNQASDQAEQGYELLDELLVVGALTPDGQRAPFSNWGNALDLLAPGVEIVSLRARGSDFLLRNGLADYRAGNAWVGRHYYRATGSSFAAPYVTGAAAILLGKHPSLTAEQVRRTLKQSALDIGPPGPDLAHGFGALNLAAALDADPRRYIEAHLTDAELDEQRLLTLYGTADADQFQRAWLEYGEGDAPELWQPLGTPLHQPVRQEALLRLPAADLPGRGLLTLRLTTEHRDGARRESRLQIQLSGGGAP